MSIVAIDYTPPRQTDPVASAATAPALSTTPAVAETSVSQIVATNVAAGIAERAALPVADNIANLSVSLAAENQISQTSADVISKPQIIQPNSDSRTIKTYITKAGDTASSVARRFGISTTTLKWANKLTSDAVAVNKRLSIPPVDGVLYTAKSGDSVHSIASRYSVSEQQLVAFNDLEITGLKPGLRLIIPGGVLPASERPGYVAAGMGAYYGAYSGGYSTIDAQIARATAGNRYAFGNCTWYAYERRAQLGKPVGSFWGNASTWDDNARAAGYSVKHKPRVGDVAQWDAFQGSSGYAGHVGIVESVGNDGSVTITEMNFAGNFNRVTSRTIPASSVTNFIH